MYQQPNYSYFTQQPMRQTSMLKGRQVSSLEEARVSSIDFDGSVFYFPDLANKKIYTKQINMDGTATLSVYELKETPVVPQATESPYITREEFEKALEQLKLDFQPKEATKFDF